MDFPDSPFGRGEEHISRIPCEGRGERILPLANDDLSRVKLPCWGKMNSCIAVWGGLQVSEGRGGWGAPLGWAGGGRWPRVDPCQPGALEYGRPNTRSVLRQKYGVEYGVDAKIPPVFKIVSTWRKGLMQRGRGTGSWLSVGGSRSCGMYARWLCGPRWRCSLWSDLSTVDGQRRAKAGLSGY